MKYFLSLLAVLTLVGAGCAQTSPSDDTPADTSSTTQNMEDTGEPIAVTLEVGADGQAIVVQETETTADEDGIPVTEIILGESADVTVNMEAANFSFSPNTITAAPGDVIQINFTKNSGFHTFVIDEIDVSFAIAQGETFIFTAPEAPGEYTFYCDIGSHRSMGMEGTLMIE
jgi:plastocyanin